MHAPSNQPRLGPTSEELTAFDAASQPRHQPLTAGAALSLLAWLTFAAILAVGLTQAIRWRTANNPERLVLGTWITTEHPGLAKITFAANRSVQATSPHGDTLAGQFGFLATAKIYINWTHRADAEEWSMRWLDGKLITRDTTTGATYRWTRN